MIPLSSIPTYSASMDSSSFLKTSFNKFPYPTKAELCYLTVVTKFPEEQIKIWFTAQRLKQGISWSPEEIEEARRKMFNTIIQTAPSSSQSQSQSSPAPPTITVLPASLGASGIPHILQGSLVGQGGVIVAPPVIANGIQVSSAPVALAVTPKPQAAAHPLMQARPAAAVVADKGVGMVVGTVGSSSAGGPVVTGNSSQAGGGGVISSQTSVINLSLSQGSAKTNGVGGKRGADCSGKSSSAASTRAANGESGRANQSSAAKSDAKVVADGKNATDSDSNASFGKSSLSAEEKGKDGDDTDDNTTSTNPDEADRSLTDSPTLRMDEPSSPASKSSSPSPATASSSTSGSRTPLSAFLDPSFYKGKKSQEQLGALKDSFQLCQFPDQDEVERLIALTGLTVREVRKWFSDRRYHFRNLKGARASTGGLSRAAGGTGNGTAGSGNSLDQNDTPQQNSSPVSPTPSQTPTSPTTPSRRLPRAPSPDFTAIRYKEREPHQVRSSFGRLFDSVVKECVWSPRTFVFCVQVRALEASFAENNEPTGEEVERLRTETKMTRREIHGWFTERRKRAAAEKKREEAEQVLLGEEETEEMEVSSGKPKVNPIKINLKMLKVTEANGKAEQEGSDNPAPQHHPSSTSTLARNASAAQPPPVTPKPTTKPTVIRGKKTVEQLEMLKQVYVRTQWPSAAQYDELISGTGLPRPEVVRWFGDCRYMQKNGQLKWLEAYQTMALAEDSKKGNVQALQAHLSVHGRLEESQVANSPTW